MDHLGLPQKLQIQIQMKYYDAGHILKKSFKEIIGADSKPVMRDLHAKVCGYRHGIARGAGG